MSLTTKVVVDEVEVLLSLMKRWNISTKGKADEEKLKKPALDLSQKLTSLLSLSSIGTFVLNSALIVEKKLLKAKHKDKDTLSLNLKDQQNIIDRFEIDHSQIMSTGEGKA